MKKLKDVKFNTGLLSFSIFSQVKVLNCMPIFSEQKKTKMKTAEVEIIKVKPTKVETKKGGSKKSTSKLSKTKSVSNYIYFKTI